MNHRDSAATVRSPASGRVLDLDQAFLRQTGEDVRAFFPRDFVDVELVLIDVDPNHIHAFWNIPPAVLESARARSGSDATMVLRLYAVDDDPAVAGEPIEVEVSGFQGRSYIGIWHAGRRYRGIIGLRTGGDDLLVLATSNEATLPPTGPAPEPAAPVNDDDGRVTEVPTLYELDAILPVSSYLLAGERVALEATAELHIHGRAEPGATVRLFGRPVPLRPDGSFLVVHVLPRHSQLLSTLLAAAAEQDGAS